MDFSTYFYILEEINDIKTDLTKMNRGINNKYAIIYFQKNDDTITYFVKNKKENTTEEFNDVFNARECAFGIVDKYSDPEQQEVDDDNHSVNNIGKTGRPFGQGFPNSPTIDDDDFYEKIVRIDYISGIDTETIEKYEENVKKQLIQLFPSLTPMADWDINSIKLHMYQEKDVNLHKKFFRALNYFQDDSPESPDNPDNYPLCVTLYDKTRTLMGSSGWGGDDGIYGDHYELINSIEVNKKTEIEPAANSLFKSLEHINTDGKPEIVLEKYKNACSEQEEQHYLDPDSLF